MILQILRMGGNIIAVIALAVLSIITPNWAKVKVTQVQVLFRHGERTPLSKELYPNDIYNISTYDEWGLGQLTNTGKMREYQMGMVLKDRYKDLLGPTYVHSDVYALSSNFDRTKMSLQLVLAALFPPSANQVWNPDLPWMPIPIHSVPQSIDILFRAHECPKFQQVYSRIERLPHFQEQFAIHKNFFEFLSEKTGLNITDPVPIYEIQGLLAAQKGMNLTLPEWCTQAVFDHMSELAVLYYHMRSYTPEIKRLESGPLVKKFIDNMRLDRTQEKPRKIYLYSGHEITVSAFLKAHGILEPKIPLFGTAVMVELLQNKSGKRFIRMMLWTGVTEQLKTLRLPGCRSICPIEKYLELTREIIPSQEELDCHYRRLTPSVFRGFTDDQVYYN
ncbi:venom acid phosphatase Acph-1-like [Neodiprion pinetum]|uniref:venom acid phosphatase Acph-1-like n=1 Tax=Neodiprion pinetum TaxID=441929 RepID=UPI001EDCE9B4|nr:venom acid phosphatase Acph-1-like [Neodiprion pinetum]